MVDSKFNNEKFLTLLKESHTFPGEYLFKFIVPVDKKPQVVSFFEGAKITLKDSKKGNYISITALKYLEEAEDVMSIYNQMSHIEGLITL